MSAGLSFLSACILNGARSTFVSARHELYTDTELPHVNFATTYLTNYGGLPSHAIMLEQRLPLPSVDGPVSYYSSRLSDRAVYRAYSERQETLHAALLAADMATVKGLFREISAIVMSVDTAQEIYALADSMQEAWVAYQVARDNPGLQGITYGWEYVDTLTGGIRGGDVGTIVARPGIGKSFIITKMAVAAWRAGASVSFISMEMSAVETARRIISMETGVNPDFLLRGRMSPWGEENVLHMLERLPGRPPFNIMVGDLSKSVSDVDAMIMEYGPDLVAVDAGYLLSPTNKKQGSRRFENMAEVGQEVKGLALRRNKPIIQTVQFNRTGGPEDEMSLDQIGGTDVVGQVSSLVLGVRRGPAPFERSRRRCSVLKNRHGPDHLDFITRFAFNPFNMDVFVDEPMIDEDGEWTGLIGEAPAVTEWSGA